MEDSIPLTLSIILTVLFIQDLVIQSFPAIPDLYHIL